jgi:hypothetical protein
MAMDRTAKRIALVARALTEVRDGPESGGMANVKNVGSISANLVELLVSEKMANVDSPSALLQHAISEHPPAFASTL